MDRYKSAFSRTTAQMAEETFKKIQTGNYDGGLVANHIQSEAEQTIEHITAIEKISNIFSKINFEAVVNGDPERAAELQVIKNNLDSLIQEKQESSNLKNILQSTDTIELKFPRWTYAEVMQYISDNGLDIAANKPLQVNEAFYDQRESREASGPQEEQPEILERPAKLAERGEEQSRGLPAISPRPALSARPAYKKITHGELVVSPHVSNTDIENSLIIFDSTDEDETKNKINLAKTTRNFCDYATKNGFAQESYICFFQRILTFQNEEGYDLFSVENDPQKIANDIVKIHERRKPLETAIQQLQRFYRDPEEDIEQCLARLEYILMEFFKHDNNEDRKNFKVEESIMKSILFLCHPDISNDLQQRRLRNNILDQPNKLESDVTLVQLLEDYDCQYRPISVVPYNPLDFNMDIRAVAAHFNVVNCDVITIKAPVSQARPNSRQQSRSPSPRRKRRSPDSQSPVTARKKSRFKDETRFHDLEARGTFRKSPTPFELRHQTPMDVREDNFSTKIYTRPKSPTPTPQAATTPTRSVTASPVQKSRSTTPEAIRPSSPSPSLWYTPNADAYGAAKRPHWTSTAGKMMTSSDPRPLHWRGTSSSPHLSTIPEVTPVVRTFPRGFVDTDGRYRRLDSPGNNEMNKHLVPRHSMAGDYADRARSRCKTSRFSEGGFAERNHGPQYNRLYSPERSLRRDERSLSRSPGNGKRFNSKSPTNSAEYSPRQIGALLRKLDPSDKEYWRNHRCFHCGGPHGYFYCKKEICQICGLPGIHSIMNSQGHRTSEGFHCKDVASQKARLSSAIDINSLEPDKTQHTVEMELQQTPTPAAMQPSNLHQTSYGDIENMEIDDSLNYPGHSLRVPENH